MASEADLAAALRERLPEIEGAAMVRLRSLAAGQSKAADPEYLDGLRTALRDGLLHAIAAVEQNPERPLPVPTALLSQARLAARHGVSLSIVLRRCLAAHALLEDFLVKEHEGAGDPPGLKRLLRTQATLIDRLIDAVSEEYEREAAPSPPSTEQRLTERVQRLLAGELFDSAELAYELDAHHLAIIAQGPAAKRAIPKALQPLGCSHLVVGRDPTTAWAWLGSHTEIDADLVERQLATDQPNGITLAIGESARSFAGWRLTHHQAKAALAVALAAGWRRSRYGDVALIASIRQDEVLVPSLRGLYLEPLESTPDGGAALRQTLRAYFGSGRQVSSAAAALGIDRGTVTNRIRTVEECLGRTLDECSLDLQAALLLDEFKTTEEHPPKRRNPPFGIPHIEDAQTIRSLKDRSPLMAG